MTTRGRRAEGPWAAVLVGVALLGVLAACGDDSDGAGSADVTTVTDSGEGEGEETTTTAVTEGTGPVVEVLDPGAEPREELRLTFEAGTEQMMTLRQVQEQTISGGGQEQSSTSSSELDMRWTIEEVDDGVATVRLVYEDARLIEADAAAEELLTEILESFVGLEGSMRVDSRGLVRAADIPQPELPAEIAAVAGDMLDGFEDQVSNLSTPFPEEPVGPGARWQVVSTAEVSGLVLTTTTTITLVESNAEGVDATAEIDLAMGGAPSGVEILRSDFGGSGTFHWAAGAVVGEFDQVLDGTTVFSAPDGTEITQFQHQEISVRRR